MLNNSTLMLYLAEIETYLMVEPYNSVDAIEGVGSMSPDHNLEVSESLGVFLWLVICYNICYYSSMARCVEAESWGVFKKEHNFEIFPTNELVE